MIGRDLLSKQMGWMIGKGESVNVWTESWLSHSEKTTPIGPALEAYLSLKVSDLLLPGSSEWNIEMIDQILPFHKEQILKIKPSTIKVPDELVWLKNPTGQYTTRSGYRSLRDESHTLTPVYDGANVDWISNVWNIKTSEKVKTFI